MSRKKENPSQNPRPVLNTHKMTPMQLEILDMFARKNLTPKEEEEIKDLLSNYFLDKAQEELESLAEEKNWDLKEQSAAWGKEKLRTPYHGEGNS